MPVAPTRADWTCKSNEYHTGSTLYPEIHRIKMQRLHNNQLFSSFDLPAVSGGLLTLPKDLAAQLALC